MSTLHSEARVPTAVGVFRVRIHDEPGDAGPIAIIGGEDFSREPTIVRLHSACFISENLGCLDCGCRRHLDFALQFIAAHGGVVVYLRREGSGRGLADLIRKGGRRFSDHSRLARESFASAAAVLKGLGVRTVRLMTDHPGDMVALEEHGVILKGHMPMGVPAGPSIDLDGVFPQSALVSGQSPDCGAEGLELNGRSPSGHHD